MKKALKRRDQKKKKSAQRWEGISKELENNKNSKQDKREENLRSRSNNGYPIPEKKGAETEGTGTGATTNGKRKMNGGEKTGVGNKKGKSGGGLSSAGFEGKKKGFINKKD